ncbi:YrdC domain-containing protein, mitochondrial [Microtus ochrogaster]|uniref:Threonylcarbamoyl-AMP synthase n=1 Tax=Microtus ochrogaster TaxID=79684 RepID=A0A8J6FZT9_MICOH|nr:YrdC domain-containing protein, mitochondrial [Microtus ochrogaster]
MGTDPATSRLRTPAAQLPQHLLAGGDGVQELPLPLLHGVQQLLGALIPGRLRGCSAALGCVYRLKGRSEAKPLAVCLGRVADVYRYCQVRVPKELLEDLLPGPVTLVMQRSGELNKDLNPFTPLVGIRIPNHAFMQDLAQMFGGPIALTSANLSSQASSLSVEEFQDLWPHLSLVIDGGPIGDSHSPECRLGSTVVDLSVPGKFTIIRPGCALENTTTILQQKYGLLPSQGSCS